MRKQCVPGLSSGGGGGRGLGTRSIVAILRTTIKSEDDQLRMCVPWMGEVCSVEASGP